eukprot:8743002-Alexandrium_andersonii.AAC.1
MVALLPPLLRHPLLRGPCLGRSRGLRPAPRRAFVFASSGMLALAVAGAVQRPCDRARSDSLRTRWPLDKCA